MRCFNRAIAKINLFALHHNLQVVKSLAPKSRVMAMVKGNAYGHGVDIVAPALAESVDFLGVATLPEALHLRQLCPKNRVVLFSGVMTQEELSCAVENRLDVVVHAPYQLALLQRFSSKVPLHIWLKVNTGMNRLGFPLSQAREALETLRELPYVKVEAAMTHFACADTPEHPAHQLQRGNMLSLPQGVSISYQNSAALFETQQAGSDVIVRPGMALYGYWPMATASRLPALQPVMTFEAKVLSTQILKAGDYVGYGAHWQAKRDTRLAVLAVGYGDGYPQVVPHGVEAYWQGHRLPLVGKVSMDTLTLDATDCSDVEEGAWVTLWGDHMGADEVACGLNRDLYGLLAGVSSRVLRCQV